MSDLARSRQFLPLDFRRLATAAGPWITVPILAGLSLTADTEASWFEPQ